MQQPLFSFIAFFKNGMPKYIFLTPSPRFTWIPVNLSGCNPFTFRWEKPHSFQKELLHIEMEMFFKNHIPI